ncbi:hypothetical protein [Shewanella oncorhynchi]|uniref:hypothetical protein n=1 Tax=Shewanella oncorhynchi TaxID=2726434 RepID=UPI003D7C0FDA
MFDNPALLLWSLVFSLFGLGFFTYGKRQGAPIPPRRWDNPDALPLFCQQPNLTRLHRHSTHRATVFCEVVTSDLCHS